MRLYGAGSVRDTPPTRLPESTGRTSCRYSELLHGGEPVSGRYTIQSVIGAWRVFIIYGSQMSVVVDDRAYEQLR